MIGQPPGSKRFLIFDVTGLTVGEPGLPPSTIIEVTRAWQVQASFEFSEALAEWAVSLPVTWTLKVWADPLGPGPKIELGTVTSRTIAGQLKYGPSDPPPVPTINVPAGTLPIGFYMLVSLVTITGIPPPPISDFFIGPIIQIIP